MAFPADFFQKSKANNLVLCIHQRKRRDFFDRTISRCCCIGNKVEKKLDWKMSRKRDASTQEREQNKTKKKGHLESTRRGEWKLRFRNQTTWQEGLSCWKNGPNLCDLAEARAISPISKAEAKNANTKAPSTHKSSFFFPSLPQQAVNRYVLRNGDGGSTKIDD